MPARPLRVRAARLPDEADALGVADFRAFREGTPEMWQAYYRDNSHLRHADGVLVAEHDGDLAGQCALLAFQLALAGVDVPAVGIAAVGVAPEYRRRGVADRLMREALRRIRKRGVPLALLYPFSVAFYRRFGYELCEWVELLRVSPAQLPGSPLRRHVRRFDPARDGAAVRVAYDKRRERATGPFVRSDYWWKERVFGRAEEWFVYVDPVTGAVAGLLGYKVVPGHGFPYQSASVHELWSTTPDAYAGLLGALAALGEQFQKIEVSLPRGHALPLLLEFGRNDVELDTRAHLGAYVATCAMARIVDVAAAFAVHPGAARVRGRLGLDLTDPVFPEQSRGLDVSFGARGASVAPGDKARARLALSIQRLSQVFLAAVPAVQLLEQGLIAGSRQAAQLLDAAFAGPPLFLSEANYF
jgi:predicted acetyltransferase